MLASTFRRFFVSIPKISNFKGVREVSVSKLKRDEIRELSKQYNLSGWIYGSHHDESHEHDSESKEKPAKTRHLEKTYVFDNWTQAFAFMDTASGVIDQMDHHPDWKHVDNEVDVRLSTHDAGNNVSLKDIILARSMDHIANQLKNQKPLSALNSPKVDLNTLATDAFHEENLEKERYVSKAAREEKWIRRVPTNLDEVHDRSKQELETTQVETSKKPAEKRGDSESSDHYTQKSNL